MLRPKSAGGSGGRSFLDDLLGTDPLDSQSTSQTGRARKSVRFFDDDPGDQEQQQPHSSSRSNRPHSSTLDSLLSSSGGRGNQAADSSRPRSSDLGTTNRSKQADWLGLSESDDNPPRRSTTGGDQQPSARSQPSSSNIKAATEPDDWITAGLRARSTAAKQQQPISAAASESPADESSNRNLLSFLQQTPIDPLPPSQPPPSTSTSTRLWNPRSNVVDGGTFTNALASTAAAAAPNKLATLEPTTQNVQPQQQPSSAPVSDEIPATASEEKDSLKTDIVQSVPSAIQKKESTILSTLADVPENETSSAVFLQTKLRILTLEKSFLEQTITQMKANQREELQSMVSLYDQQMRMTSEMYKRHEEMIQEERDRRILELRTALDHSQSELEELRFRHQQRLAAVEADWAADVARLRAAHASSTTAAAEAHQEALDRLENRLKAEAEVDRSTATAADLLRSHSRSVSELLAKWEASAHSIESLQQSVVARQEDLLLRQQALEGTSAEISNTKSLAADLERQWKDFVAQMQAAQKNTLETILSTSETGHQEQQKALEAERSKLEAERSELETLKNRFSEEVREWREREGAKATKWRDEREALRSDISLFEERRALLETLYTERKRTLEEELAKVRVTEAELEAKRAELESGRAVLASERLRLEADRAQLTANGELFAREREALSELASSLARRSEELEALSEVALKEKLDGVAAAEEVDSRQAALEGQWAAVEEAARALKAEEGRLRNERAALEQQWAALGELRATIVCNLCGSGIQQQQNSSTKFEDPRQLMQMSNYSIALASFSQSGNRNINENAPPQAVPPLFTSLLNNNWTTRPNSHQLSSPIETSADHDQRLLFWQMSAQQDAASLAEETRFLRLIRMKK